MFNIPGQAISHSASSPWTESLSNKGHHSATPWLPSSTGSPKLRCRVNTHRAQNIQLGGLAPGKRKSKGAAGSDCMSCRNASTSFTSKCASYTQAATPHLTEFCLSGSTRTGVGATGAGTETVLGPDPTFFQGLQLTSSSTDMIRQKGTD